MLGSSFEPQHWPLLLLVTCRVGGMLALAPWWSDSAVPRRWRVALAGLVGLLVTPAVFAQASDADRDAWTAAQATLPAMSVAALVEFGLGAVTGVAFRLVWSAIAWSAQFLGPLSGLTLAEVFEPGSGESDSALGRIVEITVASAWFAVGGHRQAIAAVLDTFRVAPPGEVGWPVGGVELVIQLLGQSCVAGGRAAAPLVAVLLAGWLVVGGIARLAPRSAAWMWGAGVASVLTLAGLSLSLDFISNSLRDHLSTANESVERIWEQESEERWDDRGALSGAGS